MYEPISEYLAREKKAEIDGGLVTGGRTAGDESRSASHALQAAFPRGFADMFDHDIDATIVGEAFDLGRHVLRVVIDDLVRANLTRLGEFLVGTSGGKDSSPVQRGNLDGCLSDTAAGAEHQHVLTGA